MNVDKHHPRARIALLLLAVAALMSASFVAWSLYGLKRDQSISKTDRVVVVRPIPNSDVSVIPLIPSASQEPATTQSRPRTPPITAASKTLNKSFPSVSIPVPHVKGKEKGKVPFVFPKPGDEGEEKITVLVQLSSPSALDAHLSAHRTAGPDANAANAASKEAVATQVQTITSEQNNLVGALTGAPVNGSIVYRVQRVLNAVAVSIPKSQLAAVRTMPGVKSVRLIQLEYPTGGPEQAQNKGVVGRAEKPANANSVPFLGTANIWSTFGALGNGIKVGIIDTGLDYQHPNFGGSGLLADYQANDVTLAPNAFFPSFKVGGGVDFAGDAYDGTNTPVPDKNPMDRNGHGTHVAGILGGLGVKLDGTTYTGPYTPAAAATFASTLRIGPGMAPGALLYPIRVFGTTGGTNLTVQAIEWAVDPNGDFNFSDHMDVVNISLGSPYGTLSDTSAIAAESAARLGIVMCIAAGNEGDTYFISGTPGVAEGGISVACSTDARFTSAVLQVNSPPVIAGKIACVPAAFGGGAPGPSGQTSAVILPAPVFANTPLTNAAAMAGKIALIQSGVNNFQNKVANVQAAGAIGAIVMSDVPDDPTLYTMAPTPGEPAITIPAIYISKADGDALIAQISTGVNVTLQAATSADTLAFFSSRGPRAGSPLHLKPDIAAPGVAIVSSQTGIVGTTGSIVTDPSGFLPNGIALTLSGTSMATPCVAGTMALLRQIHPTWSVEELKALAMNNALHDLTVGAGGAGVPYGPGRAGSGRIDPPASAANTVLAFNADDAGAVSVSFGDVEVVETYSQTKHVRVVNRGETSVTYQVGFNLTSTIPGVTFSTPGGSMVTVPANQSVVIDVQLDAVAAQMKHSRDPSVAGSQGSPSPLESLGTGARHWISEHAGYLNFSANGQTQLRIPVYAAPRPASLMAGPSVITTNGNPSGTTTLALHGTGVNTGSNFPNDIRSLVSPFELQVIHPYDPLRAPPEANIKYVGVAYDPSRDLILFGIVTHGAWNSPSQTSFQIYVGSGPGTGFDHILFDSSIGALASGVFGGPGSGTDVFINSIIDGNFSVNLGGPGVYVNADPGVLDTQLMNSNVRILAASPAQLGLATGVTTFRYGIATGPGSMPLSSLLNGFDYDEAIGPYTWNYAAQGLNFNGANFVDDVDGSTLSVAYNTTALAANNSLGALLIHHHNSAGNRAQTIPLQTGQTTGVDVAVMQAASTLTPAPNQLVTLTITATNNGPAVASNVIINSTLSQNLAYYSDDSAGKFNAQTGIWTVGNLPAGESATIHLVVLPQNDSVATSVVALTGISPLDINPLNDSATVTLAPVRAADLRLAVSASVQSVNPGGSISYTFFLSNAGPSTAYDVTTQVTFPAVSGLIASSATASAGTYNPSTGQWRIESVGTGLYPTLTLVYAAPNIAGTLTLSSTVTSSTAEGNPTDNTATISVAVLSPSRVSGVKTASGAFTPGSTVTYNIVLLNSGAFDQQNNPGHELVDVLPPELALLSVTASSGHAIAYVATNTVHWDGVVTAGGTVSITIAAQILAGTEGKTISNQGTIYYDPNGNGLNNASAVTDDPVLPGSNDATDFKVPLPLPIFVSGPTAYPNPGIVDVAVSFSAMTQPNAATVEWDFGDGTPTVSGKTVSHIFTVEGLYSVSATATDPVFHTTKTVIIPLSVGHDTVYSQTEEMLSATGAITFGKKRDTVAINTTLACPPNFPLKVMPLAGAPLTISLGGLTQTFTLDKFGNASNLDGHIRFRILPGAKKQMNVSVYFSGTLKNIIVSNVAVNEKGFPLRLPLVIQVGGKAFSLVLPLDFKRTPAGNSAQFKLKAHRPD